jgi:hypothetical protein
VNRSLFVAVGLALAGVLSAQGQNARSFVSAHGSDTAACRRNGIGIDATGPGVTLRLANSTVTGNIQRGWIVSSALLGSYGDNYIDGNGPNTGSLTVVGKQ